MTPFIAHTTVDCGNTYELSEWLKVLGDVDSEDDPNEPAHEECLIVSPGSGHTGCCSSKCPTKAWRSSLASGEGSSGACFATTRRAQVCQGL
jgi:hypothetical protein